jgi:hypothetical protein
MEEADNSVAKNNSNVMTDSIIKLGIISSVMIVLSIGLAYYTKNNYLNIIGLNLIILIFIGLTEYTFLNMIIKKFIAADTNYVRYLILKNLNEKLSITV